MKSWGILGGSFDPIHYGHLIIGEIVKDRLNLDKVLYIPNNISPFKLNYTVTHKEHRLNMVKLAIKNNSDFKISKVEINREPPSYTVDTIQILKNKYKDINFILIVGFDSIFYIKKWKDYSKIFSLCHIALVPRELKEIDRNKIKTWIKQNLYEFNDKIIYVDMPLINLSSSLIRDYIKLGYSVRYMLPDKVLEYIIKNNLYKV